MWVRTMPVYSKLAEPGEVPPELQARLPAGWRLSQHQVETYRALTQGDADLVFNTAMTGDGKSLAAYLPVLTSSRYHAFGMYPTIDLTRDQEQQFEGYARRLGQPVTYCSLWGAELTRLADEYNFARRGDLLKERFDNHSVILTNPDIFNLVMNYGYGSLIFSEQELPYSLCTNFDYLVFDEFHVFVMPPIVAALTAMLYIHEQSGGRHRFLFSSATPSDALLEMAERSGMRTRVIAGTYTSHAQPGYREVLRPTTLHIERLGEKETAEDWVREHIEQLASFWKDQFPRPKAAIIVNSVVLARRIRGLLDAELGARGIHVGENTGLTDPERRRASFAADVMVGTSTVDVGIDFDINLLIYESTNAGTFLQRLGRLGRCKADRPAFERYEAYALIAGKTPWVYERLAGGLAQHGIGEGDQVERPTLLHEVVRGAFGTENDFLGYAKRWGILQAAHVINVLEKRKAQGAYQSLAADLAQRYTQLFALSDLSAARRRYWHLAANDSAAQCRPILDEVLAFRGSSPFQVACIDVTVEPPALLTYDLFPLLQSAAYEVVAVEEYEHLASLRGGPSALSEAMAVLKHVMKGEEGRPLVLKVRGFHAERERLKLKVSADLSLQSDQVFVLRGLAVAEPTSVQLPAINEVLRRQPVVCYATRREPRELHRILRLPAHFPLYSACDRHRNREYTLAFGKAALMLEALLIGWRKRDVENEPIFC